ncbi:phosphomevalonate kinase [Pseudoclavibacter chungangensis]|uniref:phosphomevalonate kinase n=1 Tax=Pseudoclavibacter chungangensis TaxID=587635 RepID=A0A7J5BUE4_9MICO|nr:phosphomevalonate kinase [Pseudoclavibacter chungangensis]KAB1657955.1 phosphomevalonate kinase [Pseudoclavibacter chungangensis]NYJ65891.1 phosphomevalonate kinase [Pseudoclavibacter chungangensis]
MIVARTPGKLFIAGEYAVVEPGEPSVLVAVDRYLTVRLTESADEGRIHSGEYGHAPLVWTRGADGVSVVREHGPADYVLSAIATVERLRGERGLAPRYFDLDITSGLDDSQGRKFGLGSSAAVTVAVVAALDEFYGLALTRTERFKLSLLATIQIAPNASGGDLAACTFGGWVRYTAPDRLALRAFLDTHTIAETLDAPGWDSYSTTRLPQPESVELLVGWTGSPASTERLVDRVRHRRGDTSGPYARFLQNSGANVDALVHAIERDDTSAMLETIHTARHLLQGLGDRSDIGIETPLLAALCDAAERYGAAGKPSGAGGGDCGIVLAPRTAPVRRLLADWESHDVRRLDLTVHPPEGGPDGN